MIHPPTTTILLTGTGGKVPLTITGPTQSYAWTQAGLPTLGAPTVVGLTNGDTVAGLSITCSTTYKAGGIPGTYPTTCVAAANPNNAYTITYVSGTLTVTATTATMISPVPGSTLTSSTVTFQWTTYPGVTAVSLYVGTAPGSANIANFLTTTGATSYTVTNIPLNGGTIYARLNVNFNGALIYLDYTYTAVQMRAQILTPTPGSTTAGGKATFTWSAGYGVTQYTLYVGTTLGNRDISWSSTTAQTLTVTTLPKNGSTIYVRLYSLINGTQYYLDYTYVAGP